MFKSLIVNPFANIDEAIPLYLSIYALFDLIKIAPGRLKVVPSYHQIPMYQETKVALSKKNNSYFDF